MDEDKKHTSRNIMLITVIVALALSAIIWPLSKLGKGEASPASGDEAELRIQPVARVEMKKNDAKTDGTPRSGEEVYNTVCKACHAGGLLGAPITGDKAAWASRLAGGFDALLKSASNGKGSMPAKGGATDLSDAELKAAVDYLTGAAK